LSAYIGRLSIPVTFDDVGYILRGYTLYKLLLADEKLELLAQLLREHAPLQSALSLAAYYVFGPKEWSFYAINGFLVLALIAGVLWITSPLALLPQIAIAIVVLCTPVTANLVTEFRPDLWWGFLCGFAAYLIFDPRFLRGTVRFQVL